MYYHAAVDNTHNYIHTVEHFIAMIFISPLFTKFGD